MPYYLSQIETLDNLPHIAGSPVSLFGSNNKAYHINLSSYIIPFIGGTLTTVFSGILYRWGNKYSPLTGIVFLNVPFLLQRLEHLL